MSLELAMEVSAMDRIFRIDIVLDNDDVFQQIDLSHGQNDGALAFTGARSMHDDDRVQPPHAAIGDEDTPHGRNHFYQSGTQSSSDC